jgi:hypothetical protein
MMNAKLIFYRLISFILLPIAGLEALTIIFSLPTALNNPQMLIGLFLYCAVAIYTFASFIFFIKGVQNGKIFKPFFKDLIKVNAYVGLLLAPLFLITAVSYFTSPAVQKMMLDYITKMQEAAGRPVTDIDRWARLLRGLFTIVGIYSVVLIAHIIITLQLIKKNGALFTGANTNA